MKNGFTILEILTVICIIAIVGAITYPVFVQVKRSSVRTTCMSNLHMIGTSLTIYRIDYGGSDQGTPSDMGLPDLSRTALPNITALKCHGTDPLGSIAGYTYMWPWPGSDESAEISWASYTRFAASSSILVIDPNHQSGTGPKNLSWEHWTSLGLQLDTSVIIRTRIGYPFTVGWWIKP
jgi:prepilin-type N-terminal cleavage/methylation domain-containing protein